MSEIQKLTIDDGLMRLDINGNGLLCFNPSDFNLYNRFSAFAKELPELEEKYRQEVENGDHSASVDAELKRVRDIDLAVKKRLDGVFGGNTDFDKLLGGMNCITSVGHNGELLINNLLEELTPHLEKGVQQRMQKAAQTAKHNREQRRAMQGTV